MCLAINYDFHPKKSKESYFIAQEDIHVYKCLEKRGFHYVTPFRYIPIQFTKGKYVYPKTEFSYLKSGRYLKFVNQGIHAYVLDSAAYSLIKYCAIDGHIQHAIIPKGSKFYIGYNLDIVSDSLIVYHTKRCFDKYYPNIIGLNEYINKYKI